MKKMNKNKIINIFILINCIGFLIFFLLILIQKDSSQLSLFFRRFKDLFADFFNVLMYIGQRNPYNSDINSLGEKAYLPISYLILYPFARIGNYAYINNLKDCYTNVGIFLACIFTIISIFLFSFSMKKFCEKENVNKKILIPIYISGLFLYTIERGNLILVSISLLLLFLTYYNSDNKYKRLFASFCLALTTCLKFYPVVFGLLYLKDKKYKDAINAGIMAIIFAFIPFLFFKGGFSNLSLLFRNMSINSSTYNSVAVLDGLSIKNFCNYLFFGLLEMNEYKVIFIGKVLFILLALSSVITGIISLFNKNKFNMIAALFFMTIFLQSNSRFYCILYIVPVYILMFKDLDKNNIKKWILCLLYFLIILTPIRFLYNTFQIGDPINEYLTTFLTYIFFIVVMFNVFKEFINNKKGIKNES